MKIEGIRVKISKGEYRFSDHAFHSMIKGGIERVEIEVMEDRDVGSGG